MPTFYLDFVNGNDANDGSDWANAWKTITNGPTAARIAAGDVVRLAKSPDPTSLGQAATWTDGSNTVTLTSAVTANIDDCEAQWTASANVTSTVDASIMKEGSGCAKHVFAAGFTTGLASYYALGGATDFSSYQQVSFWVRSSLTLAADVLSVKLCSDAVGATPVDTINIPAIGSSNDWQIVTVDTAGALGASIQSVALYANSDPGTPTVYLDNILACKTSSDADALTLSSLISKNSAAQGGTEAWYPIKSLNGTSIGLDGYPDLSFAGSHPQYKGTTESVTTYKRETIALGPYATATATDNLMQDSGTVAAPIELQGGWDTGTTTQDGETFLDGINGNGYGFDINAKDHILLNHLNFVRFNYGINIDAASEGFEIDYLQTIASCNSGLVGIGYNGYIDTLQNIINCNTRNIYLANNGLIETIGNASGDGSSAQTTIALEFADNVTTFEIRNAGNLWYCKYGIDTNEGDGIIIRNASIGGSTTAGILYNNANAAAILDLYNCEIADATEIVLSTTPIPRRVRSTRHDQTDGNHYIFDAHGTLNTQNSVRHTASGVAWEISPTSEYKREDFPLEMSLCRVACAASSQVTVSAWLRRDHATDIEGRIMIKGGSMQGVSADVSDSLSVGADTWEQLSIQFTPTSAEVAEVFVQVYYPDSVGTYTHTVYVDDVTITQA